MDYRIALEFVNVFCAGTLAGAEVLVRYGMREPLTVLAEQPQIQLRQALIYQMRGLMATIFLSTAASGIAVTIVDGTGTGLLFRCAAVLAILVWTVTTFVGTVPINSATITWQPAAPPSNWRTLIGRWERLDTVRAWAAVTAFACFLTATALRDAGR